MNTFVFFLFMSERGLDEVLTDVITTLVPRSLMHFTYEESEVAVAGMTA